MYQVLGLKKLLSGVGIASTVIFVGLYVLVAPDSWTGGWRLIVASATASGVLIWIFGSTRLFPRLCRLPLINLVFPDIDGSWEGTLSSNWPEIKKRLEGRLGSGELELLPVEARVEFTVRLFYIRMVLTPNLAYSKKSETIFVRISKEPESGKIQLRYLYKNLTPEHVQGDTSEHFGAGDIELEDADTDTPKLTGSYWTNRNWREAKNTAGLVELRKVASTDKSTKFTE